MIAYDELPTTADGRHHAWDVFGGDERGSLSLVTPGIRPAGSASGDQKRIMTPGRAIAAGADYLVVGRPVIEAADPKAVADAIQAEIVQALT